LEEKINMITEIKSLAEKYFDEAVAVRRHLHAHPELSFLEVETGKFLAAKLMDYGIQHQTGWADNGIVALVKGEQSASDKVIALRADMDALPITEVNEIDYKSKNEGIMHACGHDVHSASGLMAIRILNDLKAHFSGTVKMIFQPGEERLPGGASILIKEGVLENPKPSGIIGQHVHPPLAVGKIGMKAGMYMASADEIFVTVKGKGGHGALPQNCIDTILITSHLITAMQQVVSRRANPTTPSVLTFGKIESAGGATNIIPNEVKLQGTFRTMDEEWRMEAHKIMQTLAEDLIKSMGGSIEFNIIKGYPFLKNEENLTHRLREAAITYMGAENVVTLPTRMTSEDFSFYSQLVPACFYRLGTGNKAKGIISPVHTNTFNVDEACLKIGPGLMAFLALSELN